MVRADILQAARDELSTIDATILSTAKLGRLFNRVQRDWCRRVKPISAEFTFDLIRGNQFYDLQALIPRVLEIRNVRINLSNGTIKLALGHIPYSRLPENYDKYPGVPELWSSRGTSTLILYKIPSYTSVGGVFLEAYVFAQDLGTLSGSVTNVTNTSPATVTATAHGLANGASGVNVTLSGVGGASGVNGTWPNATVIDANTLRIPVNANPGVYASGGSWIQDDGALLEFPEHHFDALVWGAAAGMCRLGQDDPQLAGRMPEFQAMYEREAALVAESESDPQSGPVAFAGDRVSGSRRANLISNWLGPNWGVDH